MWLRKLSHSIQIGVIQLDKCVNFIKFQVLELLKLIQKHLISEISWQVSTAFCVKISGNFV